MYGLSSMKFRVENLAKGDLLTVESDPPEQNVGLPIAELIEAYNHVPRTRIAVDLGDFERIDSSGIGELFALRKTMPLDGRLILARPNQFVEQVLILTHMDRVAEIVTDLKTAKARLQ